MKCKMCGSELQKQNKYCPNCGNDLFADIDLWEGTNRQNKAKKAKKSKRTKKRIYILVFCSAISLLLLCNLIFLTKLINLEKNLASQKIASNDLEEQLIESSSANNAESNITLLPTEQPAILPEPSATSSMQISAIGIWSCYGLYTNWEDESLLTTEIPDEQLSEISNEENIALIIEKDYFQYYNEIGSWTQIGNSIQLHGDDVVNAGGFYQVNDNTLHEAIRGDIVIYKRIDDLPISVDKANIIGKWDAIGYYDPEVMGNAIDPYSPVSEEYLSTEMADNQPIYITQTTFFNTFYDISNTWSLDEDGKTITVEDIDDYWLVLVDKNTLHEFYGDGPFVVYKKLE